MILYGSFTLAQKRSLFPSPANSTANSVHVATDSSKLASRPSTAPIRTSCGRDLIRQSLLNLARLSILAVITVAPWMLGGVEASVQQFLYLGILAGLLCWILAAAIETAEEARNAAPWPVMIVVLFAMLFLGTIQQLPIGSQLNGKTHDLGQQGTTATGLRALQASGIPIGTDVSSTHATPSQYPASTRLETSRRVMATIAFCLGVFLFQQRRTQLWLWAMLAVNGGALAFFGIVQKLRWNGKLFWTIPLENGGLPFASFVNRNNAAGFLNLCLAAAVGCVIWAAYCHSKRGSKRRASGRQSPRRHRSGLQALRQSFVAQLAQLDARQLAAVSLMTLIIAGVVCTLSRGGISAMVIAGLIVVPVFAGAKRQYLAALVIGLTLYLGVRLVVWVGLADDVIARVSTLTDGSGAWGERVLHWCDASRATAEFPILGTGLGTYRYAYQPYQTRLSNIWFYNADNQYVEELVEGGLVGLSLILAAIALFIIVLWKLIRSHAIHRQDGVAVVGLFALITQCVQASSDFGLLMPANMLVLALLCGAVAGKAALLRHRGSLAASFVAFPRLTHRYLRLALMGALFVIGAVSWHDVSAAATVQASYEGLPASCKRITPLVSPTALSEADVDTGIERMTRALSRRPDDAELQLSLAELWIYRYRLHAYRLIEQAQPTEQDNQPNSQHWQFTQLAMLHRAANAFQQSGNQDAMRELRADLIVVENLRPALVHLQKAQATCPILPRVDLMIASVYFLIDEGRPSGEQHIRRAALLTPGKPNALYMAGLLAHQAQLDELAFQYWRRSLELTQRYQAAILESVDDKMEFEQIVEHVLPESPEMLLDLARTQYKEEKDRQHYLLLVEKANQLIERPKSQLPDQRRHYLKAVIHRLQKRPEEAIQAYRQALKIEPLQVDWRLDLARLLHDQGRINDAHQEARFCASLAPQDQRTRRLLVELNRTALRRLPTEH